MIPLWVCLLVSSQLLIGQPAEVLHQETVIEIKNGILTKKHTWEIKINNKAGEKFTRVSIPYTGLVKVGKIEAMITGSDGKLIRKLSPGSISDRSNISNSSLYEDSYIKEFTLRHNIYPYILKYSYEEMEKQFIRIDSWLPVLSTDVPTNKAELRLIVPSGYNIRYFSEMGEPVVQDVTGKVTTYKWETSYTKNIIKSEIFAPPAIVSLPHVDIVPMNFFFGSEGSLESWITFGNWQADLIGPPEELPESEKARIRSLIDGVNDPLEILKVLYHYLQDNTRYINVSIEIGGLKPHPVSYVVANKYGDCKALSNYFRSVLHFAGIKSFYSKIYAGDTFYEVNKNFPSQSFNHIILCVPIKGDTVWVDCTSDNPLGYVGTFIQNRDVFIVERNASHFSHTPSLAPSDVEEVRVIEVTPETAPATALTMNMTFRGPKYELLKYLSTSIPGKDQISLISEYFLPSGMTAKNFSIDPIHRDSCYIKILVEAGSNMLYSLYGEDIAFRILPFEVPELKDPESRINPVLFNYPIKQTDTLIYNIPPGYTVASLPKDIMIDSPSGYCSTSFLASESKVCVSRKFTLYAGSYGNDKLNDIFSFIAQVRDSEKSILILAVKNSIP